MQLDGLAILEIMLFTLGCTALVRGRVTLTSKRVLQGKRARFLAVLFMLPLPVAFAAGFLIGGLAAAGRISPTVIPYSRNAETVFVLVILATALIYAFTARPKDDPAGGSRGPRAVPPS